MLTEIDKALVAVIMGVVILVNTFTSFHIGFNETQVTTTVALIGPILVWLIPNKTA